MSDLSNEGVVLSTGADESLLLKQDEQFDTFETLNLAPEILKAVSDLGYETPTPIQLKSIPVILDGEDMFGQAQTGTGKTAAFALPVLSKIDTQSRATQVLILEPTRELALQVSEEIAKFAKYLEDFRVVPIYGGASYETQNRALKHGAQVVVGTPGRLIDLIERGTLQLGEVQYLVIDEADEMLHMGFIDDVDWILSNTPEERQSALFSATMPPAIVKIAREHLSNPVEVKIEAKTATATTVHQRYWVASGFHKLDAMARLLEVESYDAVLIFVRTKTDAEDVSNKLMARGFACAALHGDIPQRQREKIVERLKKGSLDLIVATDVAARGLDVDRITHVINYDIPYDAESYVHRIGRTGRAGRQGEAILFVSPKERRALRMIERTTKQPIEPMVLPTIADVNKVRLENFKSEILDTIAQGGLESYEQLISELLSDDSLEPETLAAALAKLAKRGDELLLDESQPEPRQQSFNDFKEERRSSGRAPRSHDDFPRREVSSEPTPLHDFPDLKMVRFRVAVGHRDGAKPGQIVGAIANEGNIESKYIGEISIFDTFSTVDLPDGMPKDTQEVLARARVCGRPLELRVYTKEPPRRSEGSRSERFHEGGRPPRFHKEREGRFDRSDRRSLNFSGKERFRPSRSSHHR
ncbi:MAG: DEAD/DEAH box helicase [Succinivibrio sp.]|nr:DEAD/DEAH box helicase [Succinivibrio sp.]